MKKSNKNKLTRIPYPGGAGVCAGLSKYLALDVTFIRVIFIFGTLFTSLGLGVLYLILYLVVPEE